MREENSEIKGKNKNIFNNIGSNVAFKFHGAILVPSAHFTFPGQRYTLRF